MNSRSTLPFSSEELLDAMVKLSKSLIFGDERPKGDTPLIAAINRWRDEKRFDTPMEAQNVLKDLLGRMVAQKDEQIQVIMQKWHTFVDSIRVCSFCAAPDIASAWDLYADNHRGMAICIDPDVDNGLEQAQPIHYSLERPQITALKEQISHLLYNTPLQPQQRFAKNLLQKPTFLSEEKEWRVLLARNNSFKTAGDGERDEKMLAPGSIKAVYLGVNCDEKIRDAAVTATGLMRPPVKIYQQFIAKSSYKFEPQPIVTAIL
jgi:hypothetical protein